MKRPASNFSSRRVDLNQHSRIQAESAGLRVGGVERGWASDVGGAWFVAALVWIAIVYLVIPPGIYFLENTHVVGGMEANPILRSIKVFMLGASAFIILWRAGLAWLTLRSTNLLFLVCLALIALSPLWSIDPLASTERIVTLSSTVVVCFAFVLMGWHPRRVQNVVRPFFTVLLAGSIAFGILFPDLAIESGEGTLKNAWRGLTYQKNQLGILASMGTLMWLHGLLTKETKYWASLAGLAVSVACLLLSRSSTSLLATVLTCGFMVLMLYLPGSFRRYMPYVVGVFATSVVIYALAVLNMIPGLSSLLTDLALFFGKDTTFSNRSVIWGIIEEHIRLHPLLGTGYGAYWTGPVPSSPSYVFIDLMNFYPTESHNGYLEVANDLGFVGLAALIGFLIFFVRESLKLMATERNQAILYLSFFFQNAVGNLSETYWLENHFAFLVLILATFGTSRAFIDQRFERYFGARNLGGGHSAV